MRRRTFTIASLLSLVACIATAVLCVRSVWEEYDFGWAGDKMAIRVTAAQRILLLRVEMDFGPAPRQGAVTGGPVHRSFGDFFLRSSWPPRDLNWYGMYPIASYGFGQHYMTGYIFTPGVIAPQGRWVERWLILPGWLVFIMLAALPLRWWFLFRGRWRRESLGAQNRCIRCGYDLRASYDRCPECGAAVPLKSDAVT